MRRSSVPKEFKEEHAPKEPRRSDVCFGLDYHPGTNDWVEIVRGCMEEYGEKEYSPSVYKAIKRQLNGRFFYVRDELQCMARSHEKGAYCVLPQLF
jgi:hypothetical protein